MTLDLTCRGSPKISRATFWPIQRMSHRNWNVFLCSVSIFKVQRSFLHDWVTWHPEACQGSTDHVKAQRTDRSQSVQDRQILLVLVRSSPRFSIFSWSWFGPRFLFCRFRSVDSYCVKHLIRLEPGFHGPLVLYPQSVLCFMMKPKSMLHRLCSQNIRRNKIDAGLENNQKLIRRNFVWKMSDMKSKFWISSLKNFENTSKIKHHTKH